MKKKMNHDNLIDSDKSENITKSGKKESVSQEIRWDKLDNTANLFPVIAGESMSNVYRISVTLTELVTMSYYRSPGYCLTEV